MTVWKGGRGVKAPYQTTHVRIPMDIKDRVTAMAQAYKDGILSEPLSREEAITKAKEILKLKKSARVSMQSLLTAIYNTETTLEDSK